MPQKVLIVEDDENIAQLLELYLEKDGFQVQIAGDGAAGLSANKTFQPDLILLDIMLPVMNGWAVCRSIRAESKVPIIMLTAKEETEDKVQGLELGADDYVTKPFEIKELIARIHAVLRRFSGEASGNEKKLSFDKLVVNLDSYELIVDGKRWIPRRKNWSSCSTLRPRRTASIREINSWTRSGASIIWATPVRLTYISNGFGKSWKA